MIINSIPGSLRMFRKVKIWPGERSRKTLKSGWEYDVAYSKPFIKASKMLPEKYGKKYFFRSNKICLF